jgi:hypothetical protein
MLHPILSASKIAGLIGLNPYQNPDEIIYDLLCKDKEIRKRVAEIEEQAKRKPFRQVRDDVLKNKSIEGIVHAGIRACSKTGDVKGVLAEVEQYAKTAVELRYPDYAPEVQQALVSEIRGSVQKQRGLNNENHILDQYEVAQDVRVVERNTKNMRKNFGRFTILGRTDGWVEAENRIVDSKERTRFWTEVPMYDEVQLRVYMEMMGAREAELIERFPGGKMRVTKFINDAQKWNAIQQGIENAVDKMNRIAGDYDELKRIIFINTVEITHGDCSGTGGSAGTTDRAKLDL